MKRLLLGFLCFGAMGLLTLSSCQKAPELTITSPASIELSADGSNGTITFTANRGWTASSSDSWVTVSPSSGEASDKPVTVTVRCNANTTYDDRTATVTIRMEDLSQTITVRQPANFGIIVPTQAFVLTSEGRTIDVEVQANVQYTVDISVDWIRQPGTKGLSTTQYSFIIAENTTYDDREGKITIKSQNTSVPDQIITVKQAQKDAILVKDTSFDLPYGGGEIEIKVEANVAFDVKPAVDWIHYVGTKGLSSSTLKLTIDENTTYSARQGQVAITQQNGSIKHTVTIEQAGRIAVASIELDQTNLSINLGETAALVATVKPDNATDKTVSWSSSDIEIATVDEAGKVKAIKEGTATITAKAGDKTAECKVSVCIPVTSIELDNTRLELKENETVKLIATVKPDNATDKTVTWTSSDSAVVSVDSSGEVKAIKGGTATITAQAGEKMATCTVIVFSEAVDLGLSVLWASCNVGASTPEGYGDYYAWGETDPYYSNLNPITWEDGKTAGYNWASYKWCLGSEDFLTKYCLIFYGTTDKRTILEKEDDAANAKLGGYWRMPTFEEWTELKKECTWKWTTQNGIKGKRVTGPNGNSIFLPAAGRISGTGLKDVGEDGSYFSSSLYVDRDVAWMMYFNANPTGYIVGPTKRCEGLSVRPVYHTELIVSSVELDKTTLSLLLGTSKTLRAIVQPDNATYNNPVTWSSSDSAIATVDDSGKVTAMKEGTATITAQTGGRNVSCAVTVVPAAVDLGLSVLWATCNLGANAADDRGDYYAWGETAPYYDYQYPDTWPLIWKDGKTAGYDWKSYKWCDGSNRSLTKYCTNSKNGTVDNITVLDAEDDVAHILLGEKWRIPTDAEWTELKENCTWTGTTQNGVDGVLFTSKKNGASIFLPSAGYMDRVYYNGGCIYWSSSLAVNYPDCALSVGISPDYVNRSQRYRYYGHTIRPVTE